MQNTNNNIKYWILEIFSVPEDIWFRREGGDDVSVEAAAVEEVEDPRVDPQEGQADVEGDVEEDGEDDGGDQRPVPGPRLEPKFQVDHRNHGGVNAEPETKLF